MKLRKERTDRSGKKERTDRRREKRGRIGGEKREDG